MVKIISDKCYLQQQKRHLRQGKVPFLLGIQIPFTLIDKNWVVAFTFPCPCLKISKLVFGLKKEDTLEGSQCKMRYQPSEKGPNGPLQFLQIATLKMKKDGGAGGDIKIVALFFTSDGTC